MCKKIILKLLVFSCVLCLFPNGGLIHAETQAWVNVSDTSLASGTTHQMVTVFIINDVPIAAFELMFTLGLPAVTDFTTDVITIDVDTSTVPPETTFVRHCKIETEGTLTEDFDLIETLGELGDLAFLDCNWVKVVGVAKYDQPIPPGAGVLFKLYLDLLCLPDTTQDRMAGILLSPFPFSMLYDSYLNQVETQFNSGAVFADFTYCGNLLECICGDVNADGGVNITDAVYIINWLFKGGPDLCPPLMGHISFDREVTVADVIYLINYQFKSGPEPVCTRKY